MSLLDPNYTATLAALLTELTQKVEPTDLATLATDAKLETVRALLAGTLTVNTSLDLSALLTTTAFQARLPTLGRKVSSGSVSTVIASDDAIMTAIQTSTANIPVRGQTSKASSLPVVLASDSDPLTMSRAGQAVTLDVLTIAAGTSLSNAVNLVGRSVLRLNIGAAWTAADMTVQVSFDGATFSDLYDEYGNVYTVRAAASRSIYVAPGPLLGVASLKLRSGTPTTAVNQTAAATITVSSQTL